MLTLERMAANQVPFADLRPSLSETESRWRPSLEALLNRAEFVLGQEVAAFEKEFASALQAKYAIGVSSGTSALQLSLCATRMRSEANEILTTPLTAPFTAVAIAGAGFQPRFVDVDPDTLLLDTNDVGNRATSRTAAVIPVHLYGQPYPLAELATVLNGSDVTVIQDACQAHGATCGGSPFTDFSQFITYSFYPTKNLGCLGDGGAILTNDAQAARRLRAIRSGGRGRNHVSLIPGANARLDEIQACFLRAFLPQLSDWNRQRQRQARLYQEALAECIDVRIVSQRPGSVYHLFVIRTPERDRLRDWLARAGIGAGIHYPVPLHRHPAFRTRDTRRGAFPIAEKACREILSLPLRPLLADDAILHVAESVRNFFRFTSPARHT